AGSRVFNELVASLRESGEDTIPGEEAFKLYDTYGLPLELTREFAEAEGLDIDEAGYQAAMERQRSRARSARKEGRDPEARRLLRDIVSHVGETEFVGYDTTEVDGAHVLAILRDGERVDALGPGRSGDVIVDRTPFYAESGGQVGDRGEIRWDGGRGRVQDAQRPVAGIILHAVEVDEGRLEIGTEVELRVREGRRLHTMRNHTATHLLHAALRDQLGEHVRQAGSLVEPERLRFDFTHYEAVDHERIEELERAVNEAIRADIDLRIDEMAYDEAMERGALAFFGEKYGDEVRVVTVPGVSTELCGGTHVDRTGQIGAFVITHEESVAAGTRRIEALTGEAAVRSLQHYRRLVREAASRAKTPEEQLPEQVARLAERAQEAERELERLRLELASRRAHGAAEEDAVEVDGVRILRQQVDGLDSAGLRNLVDELKSRVGSGVVVIGTRRDGKAALVVGVTSDVTDRVAAGDLVRRLAEIVGGGGGGRPEMAQAGGPDGEKLDEALDRAPELVRELLEA
ncbi:MAG: alanine--tRNA ligase, partial [Acidobacteriota bacterium]